MYMPSPIPDRRGFRDHRFYLVLLLFNLVMAKIAMRFYGEQFVLLQHAISDLGSTVTRNGYPNPRSPYFFCAQMVVSGIITFRYAKLLAEREGDRRALRVRLLRICGTGFFFMTAPHNLPVTHYVHMVGGGFIFFSLWVLTMIYLTEARRRGMGIGYWVGMTVLQAAVLSYAFLFAINYERKQAAQGFGLLGLILALVWVTQVLAHVPAEALDYAEEESGDSATST